MFKRISTVLLIAIGAAFAAEGIPKEATETAPGVYRLVDKQGKAWIYRKTPFGVSKKAEEPQAAKETEAATSRSRATPFGETEERPRAAAPKSAVRTKVIEDGDTLRFERPSPFGVYKWSRKKDELTSDEKRLWESQRAANAAEKTEK
jgi:hypothetical protein